MSVFLANSRIIQIELPTPTLPVEDSWLRFAGMWADIPDDQWERFQTAISDIRQAVDQQQATLMSGFQKPDTACT